VDPVKIKQDVIMRESVCEGVWVGKREGERERMRERERRHRERERERERERDRERSTGQQSKLQHSSITFALLLLATF
jgi:Zn-finger nucleic acid-binding protein